MAQFLTLLSILLLFTVFNPIVCPSSRMINDRRDRAPYIESMERNSQYLDDTAGSRLKKGSTHNKEQPTTTTTTQTLNTPKSNQLEAKDSLVETNIRSVFSTNFGPGLFLFKNTAPFVNQTHLNSFNDDMIADEGIPYSQPSTSSPSDNEFKIQRSPDGKLSLVYNEENVAKATPAAAGKDKSNQSTDKKINIGSSKENSESRLQQTHFSDGLPLKNDKFAESLPTVDNAGPKDTSIHFPTEEPDQMATGNELEANDCLEADEVKNKKSFCSNLRNYPEKSHLDDLIKKKFTHYQSFFGEDLVLPQNISQRMNNAPNEEYLCRSRVRVIYPQSGQNKDWDWIFIVNSPQYKQGIRIEECLEPSKPCGENTGITLPINLTATCEQSYIYRSLVAYNNETIFKDTFRIPSCCKCVLRSY